MTNRENTWVHVGESPLFQFRVKNITTISFIRLQCSPRDDVLTPLKDSCITLWAKYSPYVRTADGVLCDLPPYVVASFRFDETGEAVSSALAWVLQEGSAVTICVATDTGVPEVLRDDAAERSAAAPWAASYGLGCNISVSLFGTEKLRDYYLSSWRPLLVYRWFELKDCVREATILPSRYRGPLTPNSTLKFRKRRFLHGGVREAKCISSCGNYVLWADGTMGPAGEVVPYWRRFAPARVDKRVRVRAFPHRFADIVGEVPFGCMVEAIGKKVDPSTREEYVLLVLGVLPNAASLAEAYELTYIETGKWIWGWSKIATRNGMVLLVEVSDTCGATAEGQMWVEHLPEPAFYTSASDDRRVRIRRGPSLHDDVVGHLERNEVKLAVALWHPVDGAICGAIPSEDVNNTNSDHGAGPRGEKVPQSVLHHFVEWESGGFSLLRNNDRVYLVAVELRKEPRHFPVCPRPEPQSPEIISISRKRARAESPVSEASEKAKADAPSSQLWSPSMLPEAVTMGLKSGRVRLEDLPTIESAGGSCGSLSSFEGD
ncbi:uncharacterized protein TEOVI_000645500 [Trypanosoma equiperdum]|uniref:Uncharacterized protein n=2 Tax=Trypanozoon TaxID=39700 RepID=Q387E2_TRYB2|nr:hypothetical protein, conserved [Trypanosoma brucei brucei TREU927]EAN79089.1 hypothetical protein, conserved [Trypanosoma brucei brucei TREU927]SCU67035.1 hypothetical protein, conserved [Trypanosoma equiperdum]